MSNYKIPGYLIVALGGLFLSTGGTIFKSFNVTDVWTIYFWRSLFFVPAVLIFLALSNKTISISKQFMGLGFSGVACSLLFATSSASYMFAMKYTTVANVLFIIGTQTFFLAIAGYFFLKEKINVSTAIAILLAAVGIYVMIGTKISGGTLLGNSIAFIIPFAFTIIVILIRKFKETDMVPAVAMSGIFGLILGFFLSENLMINFHDLVLAFFFGALQYAPGFICMTIGSKTTPAAKVGIFTFTEALAGPIWAWIFISETPPLGVFIGGAMIFVALLLKTYKS